MQLAEAPLLDLLELMPRDHQDSGLRFDEADPDYMEKLTAKILSHVVASLFVFAGCVFPKEAAIASAAINAKRTSAQHAGKCPKHTCRRAVACRKRQFSRSVGAPVCRNGPF